MIFASQKSSARTRAERFPRFAYANPGARLSQKNKLSQRIDAQILWPGFRRKTDYREELMRKFFVPDFHRF